MLNSKVFKIIVFVISTASAMKTHELSGNLYLEITKVQFDNQNFNYNYLKLCA